MKPFKLKIELKTPIFLSDRPVCFDALIAAAIERRFNNWDRTLVELDRCFKKTDGIYHASSMQFGVTEDEGLVACNTPVVKSMREESDLSPEHFRPTNTDGSYKRIKTDGGWQKSSFKNLSTIKSPFVIFYAYGDYELCIKYLNFCCIGLGVGGNRLGIGSMGSIEASLIDKDLSFIDQKGLPNRPLPAELFTAMNGDPKTPTSAHVRCTLPYYDPKNEKLGVIPKRTKIYYDQ